MKDIPLISAANILFGAQLFNSALILGNMALEISPKFVIIHFTMANIYAAKVNTDSQIISGDLIDNTNHMQSKE